MYECHLTYANETGGFAIPEVLKRYAQSHGWKYSAIDGDPLLGPGVKLYLTCHDGDLRKIWLKMREAASSALLPKPLREKIEHILHDPLYGLTIEHVSEAHPNPNGPREIR